MGVVKLGVGLPNGGSGIDPGEVVRLAVAAERIGLDSVWVADRWLRPHAPVTMPGVPVPITMPAESYTDVLDPIDLLSFVAARTERIGLGTSAINVLYHPPVLLARRFATLDRLSGGRLIAGVTAGWMAEEFAVAGVPATGAGARFDDHLDAMRAVWGPDPVERRGTHYPVPTSDVGPKPGRRIPLLVGYNSGAGLRRAARIGDGLHPYRNDLDVLAADLAAWRSAATEQGRDVADAPVVLRVMADPSAPGGAREAFTGPIDGWAEDLAALGALGVGHVLLQFPPGTGTDATLRHLTRLVSCADPTP